MRALLAAPLLFVVANCSLLQGARPARPKAVCQRAKVSGPFCLVLQAIGDDRLRATLCNRSDKKQTYLYGGLIQPTKLLLTGADGKALESSDDRMIMKFDNTVYRSLYSDLAPKACTQLIESRLTTSGGAYHLDWSAYRFSGVAPGRYRAQLAFEHTEDRWFEGDRSEPQKAKRGKMQGLWKGALTSNIVVLTLPNP